MAFGSAIDSAFFTDPFVEGIVSDKTIFRRAWLLNVGKNY